MNLNWRRLRRRRDHVAETTGERLHTFELPDQRGGRSESMTIRLADDHGHRNKANMLLNRKYAWRGYGDSHRIPADPNCVTFTAGAGTDVIGTLTLTVDSSAKLAADRTFGDVLAEFRNGPGTRLCELTKLAFDTSSPARPRLAALFHIIFIYGSMHYDCTDLFIEVNPRHARFYERMLGFTRLGAPRTNESVGAPSQLMWLNVGQVRRHIDRCKAANVADGKSLYSHFFSRKEEEGIYLRLARSGQLRNRGMRSVPVLANLLGFVTGQPSTLPA